MSEHTPGPWCIDPEINSDICDGNQELLASVFHMLRDGNPHSWQANARLIAAAPELLEALEAIGTMPEGYCFCFNRQRDAAAPETSHTGECRAARAAIQKATKP